MKFSRHKIAQYRYFSPMIEPASTIARNVGHNDSDYFIRIFKKAPGMAPGKFRNRLF